MTHNKKSNIEGLEITTLKIISTNGGDVLHGINVNDNSFKGFGESYFSSIDFNFIKGWKLHKKMTLNLIVPVGEIRFVIFDDRIDSITRGNFFDITLSKKNYKRLTIPPKVWFSFKGIGKKENILLNIADIIHDSKEIEKKKINQIDFTW